MSGSVNVVPRQKQLALMTAGLAALLLLAGCGGGDPAPAAPAGVIPLSDQFTGEFSLIDHDGRPVADEDFAGRVTIVYFGFAKCPDVCPLALGRLSAALNELSAGELADIASVFITVDPARDTPSALKSFLSFDPRIVGLTGDEAAAAKAREAFKVYAAPEQLPNSALGYTMNHTSLFYVLDRQGKPRAALQDTMAPAEIAEYLRYAAASWG